MPGMSSNAAMSRRPHLIAVLLALIAGASQARPVELPVEACMPGALEPTWLTAPSEGESTQTGEFTLELDIGQGGPATLEVFVPDSAGKRPLPLLLLLHGAVPPSQQAHTARVTREHWRWLADDYGFIIAALRGNGPSGGWLVEETWASLFAAVDAVGARWRIDRLRIYGWGFSAGAHVMHAFALEEPRLVAAYAAHAGALQALAGVNAPARAPVHVPVSLIVGHTDPLRPHAEADRGRFMAAGWRLGHDLNFTLFEGGHTYGQDQLERAWLDVCDFGLDLAKPQASAPGLRLQRERGQTQRAPD